MFSIKARVLQSLSSVQCIWRWKKTRISSALTAMAWVVANKECNTTQAAIFKSTMIVMCQQEGIPTAAMLQSTIWATCAPRNALEFMAAMPSSLACTSTSPPAWLQACPGEREIIKGDTRLTRDRQVPTNRQESPACRWSTVHSLNWSKISCTYGRAIIDRGWIRSNALEVVLGPAEDSTDRLQHRGRTPDSTTTVLPFHTWTSVELNLAFNSVVVKVACPLARRRYRNGHEATIRSRWARVHLLAYQVWCDVIISDRLNLRLLNYENTLKAQHSKASVCYCVPSFEWYRRMTIAKKYDSTNQPEGWHWKGVTMRKT